MGLTLLGAAFACLGTLHVLVRTSAYGAGIDVDSVSYISIASNLLAGHGFQDFLGNALLPWPPLFPLLLAAVGHLAGIEPHDASRLVNAAAFGLTILAAGLWLRRTVGSRLLAAGATLAVATSPYLDHFASTALTEALFVLLSLLALMHLDSFLNRRPTRTSLALAAACSALAATTRYAGVTVVATGALLLLLQPRQRLVARAGRSAAFAGASLLPLAAVAMRNRLLFGHWDKPSGNPDLGQSVFESLGQVAVLVRSAVVPAGGPEWLAPLLWASAVLLVAVCGAVCVASAGRRSSRRAWNASPLTVLGVFCSVYTIFIVVAVSSGRAWDAADGDGPGMSWHFLIPLYVPLLIAAAVGVDRWIGLAAAGWRTWVKTSVAGVVLAGGAGSLALGTRTSIARTAQAMESGYHGKLFNTAYWDESETIQYLRENPVDASVHANSRFGLLHAQLALKAGEDVIGKYRGFPRQLERAKQRIEEGQVLRLVWFKFDAEVGFEYDEEDLRSLPSMVVEAELADGVVFRATSGSRRAGRSGRPFAGRPPPAR